jgi:hypothetical protein
MFLDRLGMCRKSWIGVVGIQTKTGIWNFRDRNYGDDDDDNDDNNNNNKCLLMNIEIQDREMWSRKKLNRFKNTETYSRNNSECGMWK